METIDFQDKEQMQSHRVEVLKAEHRFLNGAETFSEEEVRAYLKDKHFRGEE